MWRAFGGFLFVLFAGATVTADAQAERASITGNATDKSGAALAGVQDQRFERSHQHERESNRPIPQGRTPC